MMLAQIERKLAGLKKEIEMQEKDAEDIREGARIEGSKVVAIEVDPEMYAQLQKVAKQHGVRGVRSALVLAARSGLRQLVRP